MYNYEASDDSKKWVPWNSVDDSINKIIVENGVTSIGDCVFANCESLKGIVIPNSVTTIGDDAFWECTKLESIVIPNSVTTIGYGAFGRCIDLKEIIIPNSVTIIGNGAFESCRNLKSIVIPNSVTTIGDATFMFCDGLESIVIPSSVIAIGNGAFFNCKNLKNIYYTGSEDEWNKIDIKTGNEKLQSSTIHYNSTGPDDIEQDDIINISKTEKTTSTPSQQTTSTISQGRIVKFKIGESKYILNGQNVTMDAISYIQNPGFTMVPIRYVAEALGVPSKDITFSNGTVTIQMNARTIQLTNNSDIAKVNGAEVKIGTKVAIEKGRTYAPIGEVAQLLGVTKEWDNITKTATFIN